VVGWGNNFTKTIQWIAVNQGQKEVTCDVSINVTVNDQLQTITAFSPNSIYPNPNDGNFTLKFLNPNNTLVQISISDITGKTVFETTTAQEIYNYTGNNLQSGICLVTVKNDDSFNVSKMAVK